MAKKYATPEEASAAISEANRRRWSDPAYHARMLPKALSGLKQANEKRRKLSLENIARLLADYCEPDPTGRRRYRYAGKELAARYGISVWYVFALALQHGCARNSRGEKTTAEPGRVAA